MKKISLKKILIILIILFTLIGIFGIVYGKVVNKKNSSNNLVTLNKISSKKQKEINEQSFEIIQEWNKEKDGIKLKEKNNLGFYLVVGSETSNLYDIYELTYEKSNKDYKVYSTVQYSNIKYEHRKLTYNSGTIYGSVVRVDKNNLWGYEKIEDLYESITNSDKGKIISSKGLYTKKETK